ncbi:helix-hairpin-helix domain-containing protein [Mobilitalea sibirica]|uniref:Helix-hairpin-helix domain-containing protein n=1 Tax=Mobilitalea sibirica TaxID=1462919 RepID=A0A8J7KTD6_9FIRM|nr:helix-hairpin-helix domain-containing protein [Mobilitalea sibirica]MBH1941271.1 helix-hairpin-helix domain-containing protein [Mobilitalea sibirica]
MKRKIILMSIICCFFIVAGLCYSCNYAKPDHVKPILLTTLEDGEDGNESNTSHNRKDVNLDRQNEITKMPSLEETIDIYVHVCGAVVNPGVYRAKSGDRLVDLIELAGGLTEKADDAYVNQAQEVKDGQRFYLPTKEELIELKIGEYIKGQGETVAEQGSTETLLININKATVDEFMRLPGIGQSKADSIIDYRNKNGDFNSIEDIMKIPGIKEGLYQQISSYITVN